MRNHTSKRDQYADPQVEAGDLARVLRLLSAAGRGFSRIAGANQSWGLVPDTGNLHESSDSPLE